MKIETVCALQDNYCYLVFRDGSDRAVVIDTSERAPIEEALKHRHLSLGLILNTHHHWDHIAANEDLARDHNCRIYCSSQDTERIPGVTRGLGDRESFDFDELTFQALAIPGHTQGQLAYYSREADAVFVGDTIFSMGCGRLLEGTPADMQASLNRLAKLPKNTRIYFGHEYTEKNAAFAKEVEPDNDAIDDRLRETRSAIARNGYAEAPTIESELAVNPFLRLASSSIRQSLGLRDASDLEVFTELRARRNKF